MHSSTDAMIEYTPGDLRLRAGLIDRDNREAMNLQVERIINHEQYNRTAKTFFNDIALLQLKEEISFQRNVRPICLPPTKKGFYSDAR
ncbi:hypothetical protein MTO96_049216 [Rhipicephalus appendiculatus]